MITKLMSFNLTNLFNPSFRRRSLLRNPDVVSMIRTAYTWGTNSEINRLYGNAPESDPFTLENLLEELKN